MRASFFSLEYSTTTSEKWALFALWELRGRGAPLHTNSFSVSTCSTRWPPLLLQPSAVSTYLNLSTDHSFTPGTNKPPFGAVLPESRPLRRTRQRGETACRGLCLRCDGYRQQRQHAAPRHGRAAARALHREIGSNCCGQFTPPRSVHRK
eukprot:scaffold36317_cov177-Isochrysis_galbana.AAC.3